MIFLGAISDTIVAFHWKYFINSIGYTNLNLLAANANLTNAERNYYIRLRDNENILKSIIIGKPNELKSEIDYYQTNVVNNMPLLSQYQMFLSFGSTDEILERINRKAELIVGRDIVKERMREYHDHFVELNDLLNANLFEPVSINNRITITTLKSMYSLLKNQFGINLKEYYKRISSIFSYDNLIESREPWGAYKLTFALGITVCPYCNRNYIHTSYNEHGKTRPELDHFFPKSKYPFLSISIYNLIPSCHVCNSNLKGAKDFYMEPHLHPFIEHLNGFQFEIKYLDDAIEEIVPDTETFHIVLNSVTDSEEEKTCINNSIKTFLLNELYNLHKDVAQELLFKSVYYNKTKIEELKMILGAHSGIDDNFLKRVIIGTYADINSIGKRSLSKYSYDIISKTDLKSTLDL
ncbi:HNH endonuclease [Flavobacterium sp. FlaQc-47]|uniref:HNH endonuclease n=1 Tax=Flavobacterium sp. FlaQc-47 TaxID=3374180 RepID=UPI003756A923